MSSTPSTATTTPTTTTPAIANPACADPIPLACPACRSVEHLHAVEVVEVLVKARFFLDSPETHSDQSGQLLAETQNRQPDGAIVCRNCNQIDLRYGDLVPAITLANARSARRRTPDALTLEGAS